MRAVLIPLLFTFVIACAAANVVQVVPKHDPVIVVKTIPVSVDDKSKTRSAPHQRSFSSIVQILSDLFSWGKAAKESVKPMADSVVQASNSAADAVSQAGSSAANAVSSAGTSLANAVSSAGSSVANAVTSVGNSFFGWFSNTLNSISPATLGALLGGATAFLVSGKRSLATDHAVKPAATADKPK